jgi:acetolactate synthase-1/2/3 large subunit
MAVVFVNGSYSTGTSGLRDAYPEGYGIGADYAGGTFEPPPNFSKLAEAANGYGEQVTELSQLAPALQRGLEHTRNHIPAVIAVRVPGPIQDGSGRGHR